MSDVREFRSWWVSETGAQVRATTIDELSAGDTVVRVEFSGINYKDGLALTGRPGVLRALPRVPGIDVVGYVESTQSERWNVGDRVLINGLSLGEDRDGGLAEYARVDADMLVRVPEQLSTFRAAAIGTAGFTAQLSVLAITDRGLTPADGPVLVTGAAGGVGSIAVALLSDAGFEVVASTGRVDTAGAFLRGLGADSVIDRGPLSAPGKPLQKQNYAAVLDTVGSHTLVNAIAQLRYGGIATSCGLAQGPDLPGTVLPFILRGVSLDGINSVHCPMPLRERAWTALAHDLNLDLLDGLTSSVALGDALGVAERILAGEVRGRTVVDVEA